jgi:hypothetical protein
MPHRLQQNPTSVHLFNEHYTRSASAHSPCPLPRPLRREALAGRHRETPRHHSGCSWPLACEFHTPVAAGGRACCPTRSWVGRGVPPRHKHPKLSERGGACSLSSSGGEGGGEEAPCSMRWYEQHSSGFWHQSIWHDDGERRPPLPVPLLQRRRGNRQGALPSSSRGTWATRPNVVSSNK